MPQLIINILGAITVGLCAWLLLQGYLRVRKQLLLWCGLLVWLFTGRLRRGLSKEVEILTEGWRTPTLGNELFGKADHQATAIHHFRQRLERLEQEVLHLKRRLERPSERIGVRRAAAPISRAS